MSVEAEGNLGILVLIAMILVGVYAGRGRRQTKNVAGLGAWIFLAGIAVYVAGLLADLVVGLSRESLALLHTTLPGLMGRALGLLWIPAGVVALGRWISRALGRWISRRGSQRARARGSAPRGRGPAQRVAALVVAAVLTILVGDYLYEAARAGEPAHPREPDPPSSSEREMYERARALMRVEDVADAAEAPQPSSGSEREMYERARALMRVEDVADAAEAPQPSSGEDQSAGPAVALEMFIFQPEGSQFSVDFGDTPSIRQTSVPLAGSISAGVEAVLVHRGEMQRAEFLPVPPELLSGLDNDAAITEQLELYAAANGLTNPGFYSQETTLGRVRSMRAYKQLVDDDGAPRWVTYEMEFYVGQGGMFVLYVGGPSETYPTTEILRFLSSVRRRQDP